MFGYVSVNKPELKIKDFERYRAYYCGLCHTLKKRHGRSGQITLTYDMTFLIILLTSLYESQTLEEKHGCILHPVKKHRVLINEIAEYAADMNVALSYHHFRDDWEDEKKLTGMMGGIVFKRKYKKIETRYPRQCSAIEKALTELAAMEVEGETDIDAISRPFGELMAELFDYKKDAFSETLRRMGFFLGKFIYLMDAVMDLEEDRKKGCFNPLIQKCEDSDFDTWSKNLMVLMISEAAKEMERLPLELDICILRNIIYEGVWAKYERALTKKQAQHGGKV